MTAVVTARCKGFNSLPEALSQHAPHRHPDPPGTGLARTLGTMPLDLSSFLNCSSCTCLWTGFSSETGTISTFSSHMQRCLNRNSTSSVKTQTSAQGRMEGFVVDGEESSICLVPNCGCEEEPARHDNEGQRPRPLSSTSKTQHRSLGCTG